MPKLMQTPSTITNSNANKQLRYEDSPASLMINQTCDLAMLKYVLARFVFHFRNFIFMLVFILRPKYQQHAMDKNLSLAAVSIFMKLNGNFEIDQKKI